MTDNQEKELFNILATLVIEVRTIKSDVQDVKETQNEHSRILNRLDAKTDSIPETVMIDDKRLSAVEKDVADLRGGIN